MKEREREIEIFCVLVHTPNGHNSQDSGRPKPGTRKSVQVCDMGGNGSSTWATFQCFSKMSSRELNQKEAERPGLKAVLPYGMPLLQAAA